MENPLNEESFELQLSSMKRERDTADAARSGLEYQVEDLASQRDAALEQVKVAREASQDLLLACQMVMTWAASHGVPLQGSDHDIVDACRSAIATYNKSLATLDGASLRPQATGEKG